MPAAPVRLPSAGVRAASATPGGSSGGLPSPSAGGSYASPFSPARPSSLGPAIGGCSTPAVLSRASSGSGTAPATAASPSRRQPSGLGGGAATVAAASGTAGAASGASLGRLRGASRPASGRTAAAASNGSSSGAGGPAFSLDGLDPALQQSLDAVGLQLASREWKERLSGLEALQQALPGTPAEAQLWAASQLAQRAVDANLKVQQQVGSRYALKCTEGSG